jgi:ABC-type microcin C transport system permease subunit YejE
MINALLAMTLFAFLIATLETIFLLYNRTHKYFSMAKAYAKSRFDRVFLNRYTIYLRDDKNSYRTDVWAYSKADAKIRYYDGNGTSKKVVKVRKV